MKLKNTKNFLKCGLFAFLFMAVVAGLIADPARVVSKQENLPDGGEGDSKTRIFLDITPDDENNRADAYVDLSGTNRVMSLQEFSDMIQVGDIIEYKPRSRVKDGRYLMLASIDLLELNGRNIYVIFTEDLEDRVMGRGFSNARRAYEAQQNSGR